MRTICIGPNDAGQRLDKFLLKSTTLPKSLMNKYIRKKRIKRNGARVRFDTHLMEGDVLSLYISDEFFPAGKTAPAPPQIDIDVVYEDAHVLILWKPAGMLVHTDAGSKAEETLAGGLVSYLYQTGAYRPDQEHSFIPAICNRLDRNTAGLVIAAKDAPSLRLLNEKIRLGQIDKHYLCQVEGKLTPAQGTLHGYIQKDGARNRSRVFPAPVPGSKEVRLHYQVRGYDPAADYTSADIHLLTGRSHQIRVQLSALGHPIRSDKKYGASTILDARHPRQLALCAYRLHFLPTAQDNALSYLEGRTFTRYPAWWRG